MVTARLFTAIVRKKVTILKSPEKNLTYTLKNTYRNTLTTCKLEILKFKNLVYIVV